MKALLLVLCGLGLNTVIAGLAIASMAYHGPAKADIPVPQTGQDDAKVTAPKRQGYEVNVLVDGRPLEEYTARGKYYVEALQGAEYEVQIHNPLPDTVAVALSVDGLNSIDARRTTAWNASKWVIRPYETITIGGWQMSSERARRFYFTNERDSYAAKLGQISNLGVVSAVFFRSRTPRPVPITPPPSPRPLSKDGAGSESRSEAPSTSSDQGSARRDKRESTTGAPDDEYAATGIGRSVRNDVRWITLDLDSRPVAEVTIRYEYYPALVKLGILPRHPIQPDPLRRREGASGFEDRRFSPEP